MCGIVGYVGTQRAVPIIMIVAIVAAIDATGSPAILAPVILKLP